jgi:hypothetical protein
MDAQDLEEQPVPGPRPILQLSEDVVNKIAAAEVRRMLQRIKQYRS